MSKYFGYSFLANSNPFIDNLYGIDMIISDELSKKYIRTVVYNLNIDTIPFNDDF